MTPTPSCLCSREQPWKDIFMDGATVTNPQWVITAPIMADGKHLGAIIWLSNTRCGPRLVDQGYQGVGCGQCGALMGTLGGTHGVHVV